MDKETANNIEKLRGTENYKSWAEEVKMLLQEKGAWICTKHDPLLAKTGSETESEYLKRFAAIRKEDPKLLESDVKAQGLIAKTINANFREVVHSFETSNQMWIALKEQYGVISEAHVSKCFKEFYSKKKGKTESIEEYCNYIEKRQRELRGSFYEVADRAMILVLTTSIGEEWDAFISVTRGSLRDKEGENAPLYANWKRSIVEEEVNKYKRPLTMNENSKNKGAMRLNQ
jgi:hypothetical protein